jgi:hypothetical protein
MHTVREHPEIMRRRGMSIIDKMIRNQNNCFSSGQCSFDDEDPQTHYLLGTINANQIRRWKKRHTIPWQVLMVFWNWGIRFDKKSPETGMALSKFLELLWEFCCWHSHSKTRAAALHLYFDTVQSELMPRSPIRKKKA